MDHTQTPSDCGNYTAEPKRVAENVIIKWEKTERAQFAAEHAGYRITLYAGVFLCAWRIYKDGETVATHTQYPHTNSELAAKVLIEKVLNKLVNNQ